MIKRIILIALMVALMPLLLGVSLIACGSDERETRSERSSRDSEDDEDERDTRSVANIPGDPSDLIPVDADMAIIFDVADMLDASASGHFQSDFEDWASDLMDGDIDLDDVDILVVVGDNLLLAQGDFNFAEVRANLEDTGLEAEEYRDFETWGERAALIESEDYVILGFAPTAIQDLLRSLDQGRNLLAFEQDSNLSSLLDLAGSGDITYVLPNDCEGTPTTGCNAAGLTYTILDPQAEATRVRYVFLHEDDESAEDALVELEDTFLDISEILEINDARTDGSFVILEFDIEDRGLDDFYDLVEDGPVARRVGPTAAPAATVATSFGLADRPGDSFSDAGRINPDEEASERLGRGEYHYFEFNAQRGRTYILETDAQFDSYLEIYDDSRDYLAGNDDGGSGTSSRIEWTARSSGTHFALVRGLGESDSGSYGLTLTLLDPDDHAGSFDDATRINAGDVADGSIVEGDEDYFVFDARRGRAYILQTSARFDTYIELYDEDGFELDSDDDGGEDGASLLWWTAEYSGSHYLKVRGYGSSDSGTYELSLTQIDTDDHGDSVRTATRVDFDDQVAGTVYPGGEDYFEFDVRRGRSYAFETVGNIDTEIELLDDSGGQISYNDDGGLDGGSLLQWTATSSGRYYLVVRGYSSSVAGPYVLYIAETR